MTESSIYLAKPWLKYYPEGVSESVAVDEESLSNAFDRATDQFLNRAAVIFYGNKISYRQLRELSDRFAAGLASVGVKKGDRVAFYLLNSPQFIIAYFGALKAGATVTPISPIYTSGELRHQLLDSQAQHIVCQDMLYENVRKADCPLQSIILTGIEEYLPTLKKIFRKKATRKYVQSGIKTELKDNGNIYQFQALLKEHAPSPPNITFRPKEDVATLPYTGGTTAQPKGIMLTHYNLLANQKQIQSSWPFLEPGQEVFLAYLPLFHIFGQVAIMLNGLILGATLVLLTTPDLDEILASVEEYGANIFFGVPAFYDMLKDYKKTDRINWKNLKLIVCAADTLHETTIKGWEKRTGTKILEGFGMTEVSGACHVNPYDRPKLGSFGVPLSDITAAVVNPDTNGFLPTGEVGELVVNGPNVMKGYWNRAEENINALINIEGSIWLKTGDLVKMDDEGYFYYVDRKKDLIKYKGYSVFAREIEEVIISHPQVKAAGIVGVPNPKVGQYIKAYVVLFSEGRGTISEEDIANYCREHLAHYKIPNIVEFRGELPKTDVGKISRRELREESEEILYK